MENTEDRKTDTQELDGGEMQPGGSGTAFPESPLGNIYQEPYAGSSAEFDAQSYRMPAQNAFSGNTEGNGPQSYGNPMQNAFTGNMAGFSPQGNIPVQPIGNQIPAGTPKAKKKLKDRFREDMRKFLAVMKEYPITIGCIFLATVLGMILCDSDFSEEATLNLQRILMFLAVFADGSLLTEELARHRFFSKEKLGNSQSLLVKGAFLVIAAAVSVLLTYVLSAENGLFSLGQEQTENVQVVFQRFTGCYCTVLFVMAMYLMYRRLEESFARYCIDVFSTLVKTTVVYGLFALGIAAVISIFNVLILEHSNWTLLARLEIFLAGGIYGPAVILVISEMREKIGKFAKIVVEYVLLPILLAAFAIIYLYMLKLLVGLAIPSNEVFSILSWLFFCGLPVWTMAGYFEEQFLGKVAKFLPFAFLPFVLLQGYCLGVRIAAYGLTTTRYLGIVLILLEVIYIGIYAYRIGRAAEYIIPVSLVILVLVILIPGTNMYSVVTNTQGRRLLALTEKAVLSDAEKAEAYSIYRELAWDCSIEGEAFLEAHFTEEELEGIREEYLNVGTSYAYDPWTLYSSYRSLEELDISSYRMLVAVYGNNYDDTAVDAGHFILNYNSTYEEIGTYDISGILEALEDDGDDLLDNQNLFDIGQGATLYVTKVGAEINSGEYRNVYITGYLLK